MIQLIPAIASLGNTLITRLFPDPEQRDKALLELSRMQQDGELKELATRAGIVQTEASSDHWLTATWRPITMLTLLAMLVAHWFGLLPDDVYARLTPDMWESFVDLLKIGIGGYVVSRGAEKGIREWKRPVA